MSGLSVSAEALTDHLKSVEIVDYAAIMKMNSIVPTNITELLKNSDKIKVMRLLGCDEKYRNGQASDFEFFAEWERVFPLCAGTGVAEWYREERILLGIDTTFSLHERWKQGNDTVASSFSTWPQAPCAYINVDRFVTNFIKSNTDGKPSYAELSAAMSEAIEQIAIEEIHLVAELRAADFSPPSPYHACLAWENYICGEKLNESERNTLVAQLLIDGMLVAKNELKKPVVLHLRTENPRDWTVYFAEHRLLPEEIRIGSSLDMPSALLIDRCAASEKKHRILPELIFCASDLNRDLPRRLLTLFSAYPVGGMRFGGICTDAPLLDVGHRLFRRYFARALAELCDSEDHAVAVAREFFKR